MPRTTTARNAAITTAADLFRRHGYAATGLETILSESGSPKGSFYHHFPGGKEELAVAAVGLSASGVLDRIDRAAARAPSAGAIVTAVAASQAAELRDSGYQCGCPAATVALELAGTSQQIADAAHSAFERWAEPIAAKLRAAGTGRAEAARLARWTVANLEGALVIARAAHDESIITDAASITAAVLDRSAARRAG